MIAYVVVQSLSCVQLFTTPLTAECQVPLFSTISRGLLKFMSFELVTLSKYLIFFHPLLLLPSIFPSTREFTMSWLFTSDGQGIGASASASVLPMNIQGWFPLGLSGLITLKSKGLSRVFSNTTMWEHQFFGIQSSSYSNSHIHTWLLEKKHSFNYTDLCQQNDVSAYNGRNIIWSWHYRTSSMYGSL